MNRQRVKIKQYLELIDQPIETIITQYVEYGVLVQLSIHQHLGTTQDKLHIQQLVYNQRQIKITHEDRFQLMSQQKLRRNNSQNIVRLRPTSSLKIEQKSQKNKLKHALGKINVLADGNLLVDQQERIASIYKLFECLSKTQNFYQKAFTYIYNSFNDIVYINQMDWSRQQLIFLANQTKNEMLVRLYNGVKEITFKELCGELFKELGKKLVEMEQYRSKCQHKFQELQEKLTGKNQIIKKLTGQIEYYEQHPAKEQYGYIAELEQKNHQLQIELKRSRATVKELQNNIEYLNQYNNMLNERVQELRIKIYDYEIVQFSNMNQVEKNSDLKEFQNNVELLKDLIHKGALRMASIREEYNKIDAYNQELLGQRSVLAKRAAVGFAQLTPRPNYKKIFNQYGLDYQKLIPQKTKPTTQDLVISLIKRFKEFYNKHVKVDLKLEIPRPDLGTNKNDPSSPIMEDLTKMGKQLKKVENLSIEVKTGYNKQKEDLQLLNKKNKK